jgi:hypothetical protein
VSAFFGAWRFEIYEDESRASQSFAADCRKSKYSCSN